MGSCVPVSFWIFCSSDLYSVMWMLWVCGSYEMLAIVNILNNPAGIIIMAALAEIIQAGHRFWVLLVSIIYVNDIQFSGTV